MAAVSSSWTAAGSDGDAGIADESLALGEQGFGIGEDEMSLPPTTDGTGDRLGAFFERCTCFECTSDWRAAR